MRPTAERVSILPEYERRRAAALGEYGRYGARHRALTQGVIGAVALLVWLSFQAWFHPENAWLLLLPLAALAALVPLQLRARARAFRAARLLQLYETGIARVDGSHPQSGHTGDAFAEPRHLYQRDLDILGPNSLFGLLATTRTAVGQRALAALLLEGADGTETRARQVAVQELTPLLDLREQIALLGRSAFDQLPAESFDRWLNQPLSGLPRWVRWALLAITAAIAALVVISYTHRQDIAQPLRNLEAILALQVALTLWLRPRVTAELEAAQRLPGQTNILRDGLSLLQQQQFTSPLLVELQHNATGEEQALKSLASTLLLVEQRAKEWFYLPGLLFAVGTHAAVSLEAWKGDHAQNMRRWIDTWAHFEALLALATYAADHEANTWPAIVEAASARFSAKALAHPLLPRAQAVANDIELDTANRFLLISGSNMAGKSTLLRAIGCNTVLALAGAPVCAQSMTLTPLHTGASLALVDSLAEGKSKFLAEVERLRDLVALAHAHPQNALFLIDEVFSGTNSADRLAAAQAVLRGLIREGAIGALSTHDLALAELAELPELHGQNVHMASPDDADPLGFDYLLKPGVNRTTNALAIVKLLGLAE